MTESAVWHDLECGGYGADLALWRSLAQRYGNPVLEVGAGTGRVALDLARRGHAVTALERDGVLVAELARRVGVLPVRPVTADARDFELFERFSLCLAAMQTVQLLGGPSGRAAFLRCARAHLRAGGLLVAAIVETVESFELGDGVRGPLPDMTEHRGVVYSSRPTAVRPEDGAIVLARRRERVETGGERTVQDSEVRLDALSAEELEAQAQEAGFSLAGRTRIDATGDHVGSMVVMLGA